MPKFRFLALLLVATLLVVGGCTHIKGVVLEERTGKALTTAVVTVGVPEGIGVLQNHPVDNQGRFDFQISPTDETAVYVYDSAGPAQNTLKHMDRSELSDHMTIKIHKYTPDMLPGMNQ